MTALWRWLGQILYIVVLPMVRWIVKDSQRTRLLITAEGKVLVVHGWLGDGRWSLPGGGVHANEPILAGASRELREETAVDIAAAVFQPLASEQYTGQGFSFQAHYYYAGLPKVVPVKPQWLEIREVAWVPLADLTAVTAGPDVQRARQLGGEAGLDLLQ